MLLGGGGQRQQPRRGVGRTDPEAHDVRPGQRQGARLVEDDGVDLVEQLQRASVLDEQAPARGDLEVVQQPQRGGQRGPVLRVRFDDGRAGARPEHGPRRQAGDERGHHQPVRHAFGAELAAGLEVDGAVEHARDVRRRRGGAGLLDANVDLARQDDGEGEHAVADTLLGRDRLAGHDVLIHGGRAVDDAAVDGDRLPGDDGHDVADRHRLQRPFDLDVPHAHPHGARLLPEDVGVIGAGVALDPVEQVLRAELHEAGEAEEEDVSVEERDDVEHRHQHVHADGVAAREVVHAVDHPVPRHPQLSRHGREAQRRVERVAHGGHEQGQARDGELPPVPASFVRRIRGRRAGVAGARRRGGVGKRHGVAQRAIQAAEQLRPLESRGIEHDERGRGVRVRAARPDSGHAAERAGHGRPHRSAAADQPVAEPDPAGQLVDDLPRGQDRPVTLDAPARRAVRRDGQLAQGVDVRRRGGPAVAQPPRDLLDHRARRHHAVDVLDLRGGRGGQDLDGADLRHLEDAADEPLADLSRRVGEERAADDPHPAAGGMLDGDVRRARCRTSTRLRCHGAMVLHGVGAMLRDSIPSPARADIPCGGRGPLQYHGALMRGRIA